MVRLNQASLSLNQALDRFVRGKGPLRILRPKSGFIKPEMGLVKFELGFVRPKSDFVKSLNEPKSGFVYLDTDLLILIISSLKKLS